MPNFQLHDNDNLDLPRRYNNQKNKRSLTEKFVDWGLAKDENQAQIIMIAIIIIGFSLIVLINYNTYSGHDDTYIEENFQ